MNIRKTDMPSVLEAIDDILDATDDTSALGGFDGWITPTIRLIVPRDVSGIRYLRVVTRSSDHTHLCREFAYDLLTTLLSETTNNDACDVVIRERSAHLDAHPDLDGFHGEVFGTVIIDAVIMDELS